MFTMKTKKKLAFITAMALLMGTQTASLYTNAATVDEPAAAAETVTDTAAHGVTALPLYAKAESVKEKIKAEAQELAEMTEDDADIVLSFTDATVRPGGTTYIDAIIDTKLDMSALLMAYKFDEDVFSLESVSLNEEFRSSDEMYDALMLSDDRRALIFVSETGLNVPVNGKYLVRFAFKVDENAPEGTYDITPYQKSALMDPACRYNEKTDRQENMKVFFKPGKIKVSASEKPETNIKPEPLTRKYIMEDSVMVGDTNSDQIINSMDIVGEKSYILGMAEDVKGGDTNEDGSVNVIDYIVLENALLK